VTPDGDGEGEGEGEGDGEGDGLGEPLGEGLGEGLGVTLGVGVSVMLAVDVGEDEELVIMGSVAAVALAATPIMAKVATPATVRTTVLNFDMGIPLRNV